MAIFRKNKRQFGIGFNRRVFVALFLVAILGISAVISFIMNAKAADVPVPSIEITSQNSNFASSEAGSWKVTKSAKWIDTGKAKITFNVDSVLKYDSVKKRDILMVIDVSGSMYGDKMAQVKIDAADLANTLLSDPDNKMALITFDNSANIQSAFTNDKATMVNRINNLPLGDCTNYYQGLLKADQLLRDYNYQSDRELIMLFLTDGYPNMDIPNEVAEYQELKTKYPYMTIMGIQYEMGEEIRQQIIDVSDFQFIADRSTLNNVLFTASIAPYFYEDFVITDFINDDYWTISGLEALDAQLGDVNLEYDGSTPKITWDLSGQLRSGQSATLTIEVDLKSEFYNLDDLLLPTNKHEEVVTTIEGAPNENINSPDTPILKDHYDVIYHANAPSDCDASGVVPDTTSYIVYSSVPISNNKLTCSGYEFKGWRIYTSSVRWINNDYFRMPGKDVHIYGVWGKPDILKSVEGTTHVRATAVFDSGDTVNIKMKKLAGRTTATYNTDVTEITAIVRSDQLSNMVDMNDDNYKLSAADSPLPIYAWFDEGTIYIYSDADDLYTADRANHMFGEMSALTDISALRYLNLSNTTSISQMFYGDSSLEDISPLKNWDTSKVTSMSSIFYFNRNLTNISALRNWDTSNVTSLWYAFAYTSKLEDLSPISGWNTDRVTNLGMTFAYMSKLSDLSPLSGWNTINVTDMSNTFYNDGQITNIDALSRWKTDNVKNMNSMFLSATKLENINGASSWNTSKVTDMSYMFSKAQALASISGASGWDTQHVTDMNSMFEQTKITDLNALSGWNTGAVTRFKGMFKNVTTLSDIDGVSEWTTINATDMSEMFYRTAITSLAPLKKWKTDNATTLSSMFFDAKSLSDISDVNKWNTSNVTNMSGVFHGTAITSLESLRSWNTANVTTMAYMFKDSSQITSIEPLSGWNTAKVKDMSYLFYMLRLIPSLSPISGWNTNSLENMASMFMNNDGINSVSPISGWNVSNVTNMNSLFSGMSNVNDVGVLSGWDVSNVTSMNNMFSSMDSLTDIDGLSGWSTPKLEYIYDIFYNDTNLTSVAGIAGWDTSHVKDMSYAFYNAISLVNIAPLSQLETESVETMYCMFHNSGITDLTPIANWNTANVKNMSSMFGRMEGITNVDALASWNTSSLTNTSNMFYDNTGLTDISGLRNWDMSNVTDMDRMFSNANHITDLSPIFGWTVLPTADMTDMFRYIPTTVARPDWYTLGD